MREHNGFLVLDDRRGRPFESFEAFCVEPQPWGLGYSVENIDRIIAERKERSNREKAANPLTLFDPHRPTAAEKEVLSDNTSVSQRGTGTDYILARLKRDGRHDLLKRVESGELKPKQAGREAGFVAPLPTPYDQAVRLLPKLSKAEKRRLLRALEEELGG